MVKHQVAKPDAQDDRVSTERPELIIFDCDGVLVDSELIGSRVVSTSLAQVGISISPEEVARRYSGISSDKMIADVQGRSGRALPSDFVERFREQLFEAFKTELKATPGVEKVLLELPCKICVASSSTPERIRFSLSLVNLRELFEPHIFSATQVAHGKPAPDIFLFAAQSMRVDPKRCLVVEDSVPGVRAGVAAGMKVLAFVGGSHFQGTATSTSELLKAGAATTFSDMSELRALLDV